MEGGPALLRLPASAPGSDLAASSSNALALRSSRDVVAVEGGGGAAAVLMLGYDGEERQLQQQPQLLEYPLQPQQQPQLLEYPLQGPEELQLKVVEYRGFLAEAQADIEQLQVGQGAEVEIMA